MKKIITLLLSSLITLSLFAGPYSSRISVSFYTNKNYTVVIDGRSVGANSNSLLINNIRPGQHTFDLYLVSRDYRNSARSVYSSSFVTRPQYDLDIIIDHSGSIRFYEKRAEIRRDGNDRDWNDNDRSWNEDGNFDNRYGTKAYDDRGGWNSDNGYGTNNYNRPIGNYDFMGLIQNIRSQWFGDAKYNVAKEAVSANFFTTSQLRQLLQLFPYENDRFDLAKAAYRNTVDPSAFSTLYDLFSYKAQLQLHRYVRDYK